VWCPQAIDRIGTEPDAVNRLFPAAARQCGRGDLPGAPGWSIEDAARALLLANLPLSGDALAAQVTALYQRGDAAERRAVLRTLPWLAIGTAGLPLLHDALRTNDTRLVAAALGPYSTRLDPASWRQAVLKCVFMGIPLAVVDGLRRRADGELREMLLGLAEERRAAGRSFPADAAAILDTLTTGMEA
jgi:hypothetical protein